MVLRGIAFLITGKVKAHDSPVSVCHGKLCYLKADVGALVAHSAQNQAELDAGLFPALLKACQNCLDHIIHGEPQCRVEDRGKPDLTVDNVLLIPVLHRLICHASEGLFCLHHGSGHGKGLKIQGKALELAALLEPCTKLNGILRWNGDIIFPCQINHC